MDVVLQNRGTELFLGESGEWAEASRDALAFLSVTEAMRFAATADLDRTVRPVIRVPRDKHYILMPVRDMPDHAAGPRRLKSISEQPLLQPEEAVRR